MALHTLSPVALPLIIAPVRPQLIMCLGLECWEVTVLWWEITPHPKQGQVQLLWQWALEIVWRIIVAGDKVLWPCGFSSRQGTPNFHKSLCVGFYCIWKKFFLGCFSGNITSLCMTLPFLIRGKIWFSCMSICHV